MVLYCIIIFDTYTVCEAVKKIIYNIALNCMYIVPETLRSSFLCIFCYSLGSLLPCRFTSTKPTHMELIHLSAYRLLSILLAWVQFTPQKCFVSNLNV